MLEEISENKLRSIINQVWNVISKLPKTKNVRIFFRSYDYRPVGIITNRQQLLDSSIGRHRDWAEGVTFDNRIFREPLDTINPRTLDLKSCIVSENEFVVVTARKTNDFSDDLDNFQWLVNPDHMNAWTEMKDVISAKDGIINSLQDKFNDIIKTKEFYKKQMDIYGSDLRNANAQNDNLIKQVSSLNQRLANMKTLVKLSKSMEMEVEAETQNLISAAGIRGRKHAMTDHELVLNAMKNENEIMQNASQFLPSEGGGDNTLSEIKEEFNLTRKVFEELIKKINKDNGKVEATKEET